VETNVQPAKGIGKGQCCWRWLKKTASDAASVIKYTCCTAVL